jgi:phospholipase/carboxylesterase
MSDPSAERIEGQLTPLLRTLDALGLIVRYLHPPDLEGLLAGVGAPDVDLRAARSGQPPWPEAFSALGAQLDAASDEALAAFDGLRGAGDVRSAYRALRHTPRALEALYPLARILPPVSRFFLNAERRSYELQARLLQPPPKNTGVMCFGEDPNARDSVWIYVPETYAPDTAYPLVMCLHGGSGRGRAFLWSWLRDARSHGAILVAPTSLGETWAIQGEDIDTPHLARILDFVRERWRVDPDRLLLTGMSDGGTFTYTSGLEPGSPFTHLAPVSAAFHPMLVQVADEARLSGLPIHIIHGALDWMFPVDMARNAERYFKASGASVIYREIADLSHTYPADLNSAILGWLSESHR